MKRQSYHQHDERYYTKEELRTGKIKDSIDLSNAPTDYYAPVSGEESAGTYIPIPEADRPASNVLSAGTASSWTDVDFSSYVPSGVKALLLKFILSWIGDGALDSARVTLRKNGSAETDVDKLLRIADYYTNLGSGIQRNIYGIIPIDCDLNGVIEYEHEIASGSLYLNIIGYYI